MKELSNFQGMSARNDSLLQIEEIVRIYANSKYLDGNVQWVIFILAEYRKIQKTRLEAFLIRKVGEYVNMDPGLYPTK